MQYTIKEKKQLPQSELLLLLEIPAEEVAMHRNKALERLKKDAELPGFRKGFVPEKMLRERMGEMALWEEAASNALSDALADIFQKELLDVIGRPHVETQKLAPDNPAEFKVILSIYPELTLPDYKKIASEKYSKKPEPITIVEKEIDTVIAEIKKQHESATLKKDFILTDETVKELGRFETIADFRAKVKEGLIFHKEEQNREKRGAELLDALEKKSIGEIPRILIESELSRMENELQAQIARIGSSPNGDSNGRNTFEEYLKEIKKDRGTLRKEWGKDAERRARIQIVLFQIASTEKLVPSEEEIIIEVKRLMEHYKKASPENVHSYIKMLLTNQKVLQFLEEQK